MCSEEVQDKDMWLADSGASVHMTPQKEYFLSYESFSSPKDVKIGNNETMFAFGLGTVKVRMLVSGKWENNHLSDVWFVPEVSRNLFSVSRAVDKGYDFKVDKNGCYLSKDGRVRLVGKITSRELCFKVKNPNA
ncbi:hypothetical protein AVEN_82838-1 [Araneus ventricosus]|uniref:Retrovirus-related Pol polyprotein from transposon TNT 1-94-like beta-barrel domain-containing protein n=1 Tax=Araneus ventricosus TaxID=182803 RepID=A0A4Y2F840_ARAVE|nr:hypothetical protein AVEN_82838-1 [Araneus ventricosus]